MRIATMGRTKLGRATRAPFSAASLAALVLGVGCSGDPSAPAPSGPAVDRRAFEASEAIDADSLARVDDGDGTWSYALPARFDPNTQLRGNLLVWRYAGQARYSHEPSRPGPRTFVARKDEPASRTERIDAMTRIDRLGRIWKVRSVDEAAWAEATAPHPAELEHEPRSPRAANRPLDPEPAPGTLVSWTPMSWDHQSCRPTSVASVPSARDTAHAPQRRREREAATEALLGRPSQRRADLRAVDVGDSRQHVGIIDGQSFQHRADDRVRVGRRMRGLEVRAERLVVVARLAHGTRLAHA